MNLSLYSNEIVNDCLERMKQAKFENSPIDWDLYELSHVPVHMINDKRWKDVDELLTNLEFIESKCAAKMTLDLLNDYSLMLQTIDKSVLSNPGQIEEFGRFIKSQSHILQTHPALTFQQAVNQPRETAPSQIAMRHWVAGNERRSWLRVAHREVGGIPVLIAFRAEKQITATAISFLGERIAISDGEVRVYNVRSGQEIFHLSGDSGSVISTIALSPDGRFLACTERIKDYFGKCSVWNIDEREKIVELDNYCCQILTLRFSSNGDLLGLGGKNISGGVVAIWNISENTLQWRKDIPRAIARKVAFLPDDLSLVAGQGDGVCSFWRTSDGAQEKIIRSHPDAIVTDLCISKGGNLIATSSTDGFCRIQPINDKQGLLSRFQSKNIFSKSQNGILFSDQSAPPSSIAFLDDAHVISGDIEGFCHIWNSVDGKLIGSPFSGEGKILSIEVSGNDEFLLMASADDQACRIFEIKTILSIGTRPSSQTRFLCFLQDSNELAVLRKDGQLEFISLENNIFNRNTRPQFSFDSKALTWTVSPDGRFILSLDPQGHWKLWDRTQNKVVNGKCNIVVGTGAVACISPDGSFIGAFYQENLELISVDNKQYPPIRLPMIIGAMKFRTNDTLEVVGINTSFKNFQAENVIYLQVQPFLENSDFIFSGPFGDDPVRGKSGFLFGATDTFIEWSTQTNGKGKVILWDNKIKCHGMREFSSAVKVHAVTLDGKWILLSQLSTSMCYILDATTEDMEIIWSFPLTEALLSGSIQDTGDLVALSYKQGGLDILQRINSGKKGESDVSIHKR